MLCIKGNLSIVAIRISLESSRWKRNIYFFTYPILFSFSFSVWRHDLYNPENVQKLACPRCTKMFKRKKDLNYHIRHFCGIGIRLKCPYCEKYCKHSGSIAYHIKTYHSGKSVYYLKLV